MADTKAPPVPRTPPIPRIPRFQVQQVRIKGTRSDGSEFIRETYRVVVNVGVGRKRADRLAEFLSDELPAILKAHEAGQRALAFVDDAFEAVRRDHVGCDWDGGEIQDQLVHRGFLEERQVNAPCGEQCGCAEMCDFPTTCYFPTEFERQAAIAGHRPTTPPAASPERKCSSEFSYGGFIAVCQLNAGHDGCHSPFPVPPAASEPTEETSDV